MAARTDGNPAGRPRGSKNKLNEAFVADLYREWQTSGPAALKKMVENDPASFCRMIASVLPKEMDTNISLHSVNLFAESKTFLEAFRLAKAYLADESARPLIELEQIDDE